MFKTIQPHEIKDNSSLITKSFQLRKKVFSDQLGWDVPVIGDQEFDAYDGPNASYLVWASDDGETLYGVVRLMATNGPTLLHDVFHATHGRNPELIAADVWEGTRMCVDEGAVARDFPDMPAAHGFNLLFTALCEAALAHNIRRLVSNFEPCMSRVYRRCGLKYDLHGRSDIYGKKPVYCASFEVSPQVLREMRAKVGVDMPVYQKSRTFSPLVAAALEPMKVSV